jgi:hypothetical protein
VVVAVRLGRSTAIVMSVKGGDTTPAGSCTCRGGWVSLADRSRPGQAEVMINVLWVGLPRLHQASVDQLSVYNFAIED